MTRFYGCDAHKKYSLFTWVEESGLSGPFFRVKNERSEFRDYPGTLPTGALIALETVGNWYWMVEEMEKAGHLPFLTNAAKVKATMGKINKTDKLDAMGLGTLLRNGTLPSVWITPDELRNKRELSRTSMALVRMRTIIKNRVHTILSKYALHKGDISDIFGLKARPRLRSFRHILGNVYLKSWNFWIR